MGILFTSQKRVFPGTLVDRAERRGRGFYKPLTFPCYVPPLG
jgi:hypothetical protein